MVADFRFRTRTISSFRDSTLGKVSLPVLQRCCNQDRQDARVQSRGREFESLLDGEPNMISVKTVA